MRPRALYIVGPPGAGKSTLLDSIVGVNGSPAQALDVRWPLLRGQLYADEWGRSTVRLGGPHALFSGTDRLSMAVHPQAVEWAYRGKLPDVVIGEGARLGTVRFLAALHDRTDLLAVYLDPPTAVVEERRGRRGTGQDEAWARGASTRARNTANGARGLGIRVLRTGDDGEAYDAGRSWLRPEHAGHKL